MDSKQKARELIQRFLYKYIQYANTEVNYKELAKESALICVDEILYELEDIEDGYRMDRVEYWQEVKQEIKQSGL